MNCISRYLIPFLLFISGIFFLNACANMASPTGGLYDEAPPKVLNATPPFNTLNVSRNVIEIEFDENVKVEKPNEKVIITPPQINMPVVRAIGKKVRVELNDELLPNTTYTIDFTDAIVDNNEGNPLENFSISFSTGNELDTLAVSGKVLAAADLEPVSGIYVGMHTNLHDSAFTNVTFERISRTDSRGNFTVRGLAPGSYKIFALNDLNRDYKYDNPQEAVAFLDSIIVPSSIPAVRQDTIINPKDSTIIDSVKSVNYTRFLPDDILLRSFLSDYQRQYYQKNERPQRHKLSIFFAAPTTEPNFRLLKPSSTNPDWYLLEKSKDNDTITLWITDSLIYRQDSIQLIMDYVKTDVVTNINVQETDTINFNFREPRQQSRRDDDEEVQIRFLSVNHNIQSNHEIYAPIRIEFEQPVTAFNSSHARLYKQVDTIYQPIDYELITDSLNPRKYTLTHQWEPEGKYRLSIDSAAVTSYYGLWNNKLQQDFTIKALDQYGNILFNISGLPTGKTAYVELLDKSDKPFRKTIVKNNEALFFDINPGTIYARLFIDDNEDGEWTTGDYANKRQPEMVYYYPRAYEIRAFTDHEESWNLQALPLHQQKPLDITKNKPQERQRRNLNEERESERQNQNQRSTPFSQGMGGSTRGLQTPGTMR